MDTLPTIPAPEPEPRVVIDYSGCQVLDAREHIRFEVKADVPSGLRWCLKDAGFRPVTSSKKTWQRKSCPDAIFQAQSIASTFFGDST